ISAGKPAAKFTSPRRIALLVSPLITQLCAIICIHVPLSETSEPMMYRRNGPCRKSASDFDPTHFYCAFIANTHRCRGVCVKRRSAQRGEDQCSEEVFRSSGHTETLPSGYR